MKTTAEELSQRFIADITGTPLTGVRAYLADAAPPERREFDSTQLRRGGDGNDAKQESRKSRFIDGARCKRGRTICGNVGTVSNAGDASSE